MLQLGVDNATRGRMGERGEGEGIAGHGKGVVGGGG
jgi:hypothetical protein